MLAHVHLPTGFSLSFLIYQISTRSYIPHVVVYYHDDPALVKPGPKSYLSSRYSNVSILNWKGMERLTVESTIEGDDVLLLFTPFGSNNSDFRIVFMPQMKYIFHFSPLLIHCSDGRDKAIFLFQAMEVTLFVRCQDFLQSRRSYQPRVLCCLRVEIYLISRFQ